MLKSIEIADLRGIREGNLGPFNKLNILTGPTGSGKSTVLDAVHIALCGGAVPWQRIWGGTWVYRGKSEGYVSYQELGWDGYSARYSVYGMMESQDDPMPPAWLVEPDTQDVSTFSDYMKPYLTQLGYEWIQHENKAWTTQVAKGSCKLSINHLSQGERLILEVARALNDPHVAVLLESPEVGISNKTAQIMSSVIWDGIAKGRQVFIATHSSDLIHSLIANDDESEATLHLLHRDSEGILDYKQWTGEELDFTLFEMGLDLRC